MSEQVLYLVDDDPQVRRALGRFFLRAGLKVRDYATAGGFLEALDGEAAGCVLLDFQLGDGSGTEVLRELRRRDLDLSVILLTGYVESSGVEEARALGAQQVLEKPQDPRYLLEQVRACFVAPS
jgi:two-component system, LuxR family, response regulator FixJ